MRIRVTIEYHWDILPGLPSATYREALIAEKEAWINGDVDAHDVLNCGDDSATFDLRNV